MAATTLTMPIANGPAFLSSSYCSIHRSWSESLARFVPDFGRLSPDALWHQARGLIFTSTELEKSLKSLSQLKVDDLNKKFDESDIMSISAAFKSHDFPHYRYYIAKIFGNLDEAQMNSALKKLFVETDPKQFTSLIKNLNSLLTLQKVEAAVGSEFDGSFRGAVNSARTTASYAELKHLTNTSAKKNSLAKIAQYYVVHTLDWLVDTFLYIFQLKELADDHADLMDKQVIAEMRYRAFRDNLAIISGWLIALTFYTKSVATTSIIAGSITGAVAALLIIYTKFFKPPPEYVHPCINKTKEAKLGLLPPVTGREKEIKDFLCTFQPFNASVKKSPLFVAKPGVGKTETFNGAALYLISDDYQGPSYLKGANLLVVNASNLLNNGIEGDAEHLEVLLRQMRGFEKKFILCIDEAHILFKVKKGKAAHLMRTLMDACVVAPYFAFATTQEDFGKYIKNDEAFMRRLNIIDLPSLSSEQTFLALYEQWKREAPEIEVDYQALEMLSTLNDPVLYKNQSQPFTSKALLTEAFTLARCPRIPEVEKQLEDKQTKLKDLLVKSDMQPGAKALPYSRQGEANDEIFNSLKNEIASLKKQQRKNDKKAAAFQALIKQREDLKLTKDKLAMQIAKASKDNPLSEDLLKYYLFLTNYLLVALDQIIEDKKDNVAKLGYFVTVEMVEKLIAKKRAQMEEEKISAEKQQEGSSSSNKDKERVD